MDHNANAVRRIMFSTYKIDGAYYLYAKKLGINENALALFYALDDGKPHSQKQISHDCLIPKTTVNTIVKELAAEGYITLMPDGHTREKNIGLTPKGKAYANEIMRQSYAAEQLAFAKTLEKFSPAFVDALDCFTDSLCEALQTITPK